MMFLKVYVAVWGAMYFGLFVYTFAVAWRKGKGGTFDILKTAWVSGFLAILPACGLYFALDLLKTCG